MAEVELHIGGHRYQVACADGEETSLLQLGAIVDEQIQSARLMAGGLTETRQLLFAAILLADRIHEATNSTATPNAGTSVAVDEPAVLSTLAALTDRVAQLTARIDALT